MQKTGRITGALLGLLTVMKGLPLAYAKDMQEDKEPVFEATEALALSLAAVGGMVGDMQPDAARMRAVAGQRICHGHRPGRLAGARGRPAVPHGTPRDRRGWWPGRRAKGWIWAGLSLDEMRAEAPAITQDVFGVLGVDASVASRTSHGGTAPGNVAARAALWLERLA